MPVLLRTQSDDRLTALARDGHERAFEAIVERYRKPLLRSAKRVLGDSRAEDAVQHAFIAAWNALQRGDEVRELRPWLYRIIHNSALNVLRVKGYDYAELQESLGVSDAPEEELERRLVVRETLTGLAGLPERQREALLGTAVQGLSHEQIAAQMGISDGAVRQLVHRARASLRTAVTAVTPLPLLQWMATSGGRGQVTERVAELVAGGGAAGGAALLAKAGTVAVLAGGVATGGVLLDDNSTDRAKAEAKAAQSASRPPTPAPSGSAAAAPVASLAADSADSRDDGRSGRRRGSDDDDHGDDRSGRRGGGDDGRREDSSGSSGSGSGGDDHESDDDRSGSGSGSGSGSSGSGSGDDDEPDHSGSNSGAGSGSGSEEPERRAEPEDTPEPQETPEPDKTPDADDTPEPDRIDNSGSGSRSSGSGSSD